MVRIIPVVACVLTIAANTTYADFSYPDFNSTAGLNLLGSASTVGPTLELNPAARNQAGSAFVVAPQALAGGFDTSFQFQITNPFGLGADGFAFNSAATNNVNMDINSAMFSVFFDTYDNGPPDLSDNEVVLFFNGTRLKTVDLYPLGVNMSDGQVHTARITYSGDTVNVSVDAKAALSASGIDLGMFGPTPYAGLSGFTGQDGEIHDIKSWSLTTQAVPEPACLLMLGTGAVGLLGYVRRRRANGA